jgi:hypothetical protein
MDKISAFNLIVNVVLQRATGISVEIDQWKQALEVLKEVMEPKVQEGTVVDNPTK